MRIQDAAASKPPPPGDLLPLGEKERSTLHQKSLPLKYLAISAAATWLSLVMAPRAFAQDSINVMDYAADPTGMTDSAGDFVSAMTAACGFSPPKSVSVPRDGKFLFNESAPIPTGCSGLTIHGQNWTIEVGSTNTGNPETFSASGMDNITIQGFTIDGSQNTTNTHGMMSFYAPMRGLTLVNDTFQNGYLNNGIWFYGPTTEVSYQGSALTGTLSTAVTGTSSSYTGDTQMTLASIPAGLHVGAYLNSSLAENDIYVTSITIATNIVGVNIPISDSIAAGSMITFTPAASLTSSASQASSVITLDTTAGIKIGQTAWQSGGTCLPVNDRVLSISGSNVTLEAPPICPLASGSPIAFASGFANVMLSGMTATNLGQGFRNSVVFTANETVDAPVGTYAMTFQCLQSACAGEIGLSPGDIASSPAQYGLSPGNPIVGRTISPPDYTVTFRNPMTADTPVGSPTPINYSFNISGTAGNGYVYWSGYGAWFSNRGWIDNNGNYSNTWSSSIFMTNMDGFILSNTKGYLNSKQTITPKMAGSALAAFATSGNIQVTHVTEDGATGVGIAFDHDIDVSVIGGSFAHNGDSGIDVTGGRGIHISGGVTVKDNNQACVRQLPQVNGLCTGTTSSNGEGNGITLSGSATYSSPGTLTGVTIGQVYAYDDQASPTQFYGVGKGNAASNTNQPVSVTFDNTVVGTGNLTGLISPAL